MFVGRSRSSLEPAAVLPESGAFSFANLEGWAAGAPKDDGSEFSDIDIVVEVVRVDCISSTSSTFTSTEAEAASELAALFSHRSSMEGTSLICEGAR